MTLTRIFRAGGRIGVVAEICHLLYRRLAACGALEDGEASDSPTFCRLQIGDTAGCKPALRRADTSVAEFECEISFSFINLQPSTLNH